MLLGLMLAAATVSGSSNVDYGALGARKGAALFVPLLIPVFVLAVPFVDLLLAIAAGPGRGGRSSSPTRSTCTTGCSTSGTRTAGPC
jgi:UDP-GlcNAc:undecaprenyl-phosphate GlcNAc-1-phosphate transferase